MTMDPIKSEDVDIRPYAQTTSLNFHYIDLPFINTNDIVPAGIDIGYSGLKVYSVFGYHILPSLPIRVYNEQPFVEVDTDICYRDEKGNLWYIEKQPEEHWIEWKTTHRILFCMDVLEFKMKNIEY